MVRTVNDVISSAQTNTHTVGSSTFTETITDTSTTQENGNAVTGDYTRGLTDTLTMTDTDSGSDAAGSFSVTESSSQVATGTQTGNQITSAYSLSQSTTGSHSMTETGSSFTLSETGSLSYTTNENGNTIDGQYSRTLAGGDSYTLTENGTNGGGAFTETVTGSDNYTLTDIGNPGTQTFGRSIVGTGSYTRTDTGPGATLPSGTGTIGYNLQESADVRGAVFSQTETGGDRYSLLEHFNDVSNTGNGNTPGNMNFFPFGQPFVDPQAPPRANPDEPRSWGQLGEIFWAGPASLIDSGISIAQGGLGTVQAGAGFVTGNPHWGAARLDAAYDRGPGGQARVDPVRVANEAVAIGEFVVSSPGGAVRAGAQGALVGGAAAADGISGGYVPPLNDFVEGNVAEYGDTTIAISRAGGVVAREAAIVVVTVGAGNIIRAGTVAGQSRTPIWVARGVVAAATVREGVLTVQSAQATVDAVERGDNVGVIVNGVSTILSGFGTVQGIQGVIAHSPIHPVVSAPRTPPVFPLLFTIWVLRLRRVKPLTPTGLPRRLHNNVSK